MWGQLAFGQTDSLKKWHLYGAGGGYMDGLSQYFEGYSHEVMLMNASSGLPLYSDWDNYSRLAFTPGFWQTGAWVKFANPNKKSQLRVNLTYTFRSDTLVYTSLFETGDTSFGRSAIENTRMVFAGVSFMQSTRMVAKFFRLYVGAEGDFGFGPRTKIDFAEYKFDIREGRLLEVNEFPSIGNPRFQIFASALLGVEFCFLRHFGLTAEVRSGFGGHFVVSEKPVGMSKTVWNLGANYYFKSY